MSAKSRGYLHSYAKAIQHDIMSKIPKEIATIIVDFIQSRWIFDIYSDEFDIVIGIYDNDEDFAPRFERSYIWVQRLTSY